MLGIAEYFPTKGPLSKLWQTDSVLNAEKERKGPAEEVLHEDLVGPVGLLVGGNLQELLAVLLHEHVAVAEAVLEDEDRQLVTVPVLHEYEVEAVGLDGPAPLGVVASQ